MSRPIAILGAVVFAGVAAATVAPAIADSSDASEAVPAPSASAGPEDQYQEPLEEPSEEPSEESSAAPTYNEPQPEPSEAQSASSTPQPSTEPSYGDEEPEPQASSSEPEPQPSSSEPEPTQHSSEPSPDPTPGQFSADPEPTESMADPIGSGRPPVSASADELAHTGANAAPMLAATLLALGAGTGLVALGRKRMNGLGEND